MVRWADASLRAGANASLRAPLMFDYVQVLLVPLLQELLLLLRFLVPLLVQYVDRVCSSFRTLTDPLHPPTPPHPQPLMKRVRAQLVSNVNTSPPPRRVMYQGREVSKCEWREVSLQSVKGTQKMFRGVK